FFTASILRILISGLSGKMDIYNENIIFSKLSLAFIYLFVFLIIVFGIIYLLGLFKINISGLDFSVINLF
ncbi:MAG TPA: hypothetical protein DCY00_01255, partial [Actinobacteria bacterium]|nr:hypothetical protein [Actinomycetota bacterium]